MSHILVLPASPTSEHFDVRVRYATVPISRLQLELWSNYAAIIQTLMRGDGHVCDLRLWADVTFHHEFPVKSVFRAPGYVGAANFVFSGLDHYDGGLHFETDFVSIEKLTNDLRSAS